MGPCRVQCQTHAKGNGVLTYDGFSGSYPSQSSWFRRRGVFGRAPPTTMASGFDFFGLCSTSLGELDPKPFVGDNFSSAPAS